MDQIEQKFEIKEIIGSGMYGNVHKAVNRETGEKVAVKIV